MIGRYVVLGLLGANLSHAAIVAEAPMQSGAVVLIHDIAGPCVRGAMLAEHVAKNGDKTPGCYMQRGDHLMIVFLDVELGAVPISTLRKPTEI